MTRREWLASLALVLLSAAVTGLLWKHLAGRELPVTWFGQRLVLSSPERLALCGCLPLLAAGAYLDIGDTTPWQRVVSGCLRAALLVCLALALSRPARLVFSQRVSVVFAADISDSLDGPARVRQHAFVEAAGHYQHDNDLRLLQFAGTARPVPNLAELTGTAELQASGARQSTDLQAALRLAYALHAPDQAARVVLLTDGRQTHGDLLAEAATAARLGVQIDHVLVSATPPNELGIRAIQLPDAIEVGRPFHVHVELFANRPSDARLTLVQADNAAPALTRELHLAQGATSLDFPALVRVAGPIEYRAELLPHAADTFSGNNRASAMGFAHGRARVLMLDPEPLQLQAASQILLRHDFDVEVRPDTAAPRTWSELVGYDFVIVSDASAERLPTGFVELLERFVRDSGGGLLVAGGDHSFGLGGYQNTRFQQLLPVRMSGEVQRDEHSLALALLIDCSGSMAGIKIDLAKEAARAAVEVLSEQDLIEVIGFSGEPDRQVRMQSARNRVGVTQNIARLIAQGGTQLFPALDLAYQDLAMARARLKHVILLTDGQTQESGIAEVVQAMHSENITVSVVGLGRDVNRELLQTVSSLGAGRAYFTDDPRNVPRIFVHETTAQKRNSAVEHTTRLQLRQNASFLRGLDIAHAPAVRGYVATQAKPLPAEVLFESDTGEPLLARQRVGLGFALAFTSDLKARWTADLMRWPDFDGLLAQLVREHARRPNPEALPMSVTVQQGLATIVVDARDPDQRFIHGLTSRVAQLGRDEPAVTLHEAAPGRYEGTLPLAEYGTFSLRATHSQHGQLLGHSDAQASNPSPTEYDAAPANAALLARVSTLTSGRALHEPSMAFRPPRHPRQVKQALWPQLTWLALALYLLDLLMRRVRPLARNASPTAPTAA